MACRRWRHQDGFVSYQVLYELPQPMHGHEPIADRSRMQHGGRSKPAARFAVTHHNGCKELVDLHDKQAKMPVQKY